MSVALKFGGFSVPMSKTCKEWMLSRRSPILMGNVPYSRKTKFVSLAIERKIKTPINANVRWIRIGQKVCDDFVVPNGDEVRNVVVVPNSDEVPDRVQNGNGTPITVDERSQLAVFKLILGRFVLKYMAIKSVERIQNGNIALTTGESVQNGNDTPITVDERSQLAVLKLILGRVVLTYVAIKSVERIQNGNNPLTTGESVQNDNDTPITVDERSQLARDGVIMPDRDEVRYGVIMPDADEVREGVIMADSDDDRDEDHDDAIIQNGDEDLNTAIISYGSWPTGDGDAVSERS